jgi:hypothetical protein
MQTKIDLCGAALLKIGEKAIVGFNDDSAAAEVANKLYDNAVENLLCLHAWRFATKKCRPPKTIDGEFVLPPNLLRVLSCSHPKFEVMGDRIICGADELEVSFIERVGESDFPAYFRAPLITKLSLEFCIPLTGNQNMRALLNALFESELRIAKFIDSCAGPNRAMENFPLLTARF